MTADPETQILYARQGIYNRALGVAGFELLYRDSVLPNAFPADFDGTRATSRVLVNAFARNASPRFSRRLPAFINFTADALSRRLPMDHDRVVVEVLESVNPNARVIAAITRLKALGCRIALDDYDQPDAEHPLLAYADIVKIDLPRLPAHDLAATVAALKQRRPGLIVVAEKIETQAELARCMAAGCDLFQGYHLARPTLVLAGVGERNPGRVGRRHSELARQRDAARMAARLRHEPGLLDCVMTLASRLGNAVDHQIDNSHQAVEAMGWDRLGALFELVGNAAFPLPSNAPGLQAGLRC